MNYADDTRQIRVIQYLPGNGGVEHTVTQAFLNMKAREFYRKVCFAQQEKGGERPRVCIAGFMDFLWLRSYCADYLGNAPMFDTGVQSMPENFPKHFTWRGVLIIEALENETGYTFA